MAKSRADTSPTHLDANLSKPSAVGPPNSDRMTLLISEGLAWERFNQAITNKDIAIYYDMFVKEFEQSTVHDLFKAL